MARLLYGGTPADFAVSTSGLPVSGAVLEVWSARTGGTQIVDLTDMDDAACTEVTSDSSGLVAFHGPDGETGVLWVDSGVGSRLAIRPTDPPAAAVTGVRDDPESALARLLTALDGAGLIDDQTTATEA